MKRAEEGGSMIDPSQRSRKQQEKDKTRKRMNVKIDPSNYEYFPAKKQVDYSKKFLAEHEADISIHKAAKKYFDDQGLESSSTGLS